MSNQADVIVIGGGAAGLTCAGAAAKRGLSVIVLERGERLAKKVLITGKGRCNVTNNCTPDDFMKAVRTNPRFLFSAINTFTPHDTMALFEDLGVPLKTERGNRVFPCSDSAADIAGALIRYAKSGGAQIEQGRVGKLLIEGGVLTGVECADGQRIYGRAVVVATGGKSYPLTGSDGDGYRLAKQAGHTVVSPQASLVPIVTEESWCRDLMGLSLKNVTLTAIDTVKNKPVYHEMGEMLFTHFGVSGPLVLSASSHMNSDPKQYKLSIDLKPALSVQQLDLRLLRDFGEKLNRDFINSLGDLLPRKMIPVIVKLSGIDGGQKVNSITKEQRKNLVSLLKGLPLRVRGFRPIEEAIITAGGVSVKEISPKTMESKKLEGLFFAGEVMDLDAYTGGYNLQIAFSTAVAAGNGVCE